MNRASGLRLLAIVSAALAYLQATLGGIVRVTGSGEGCNGWPLCSGHAYPAFDIHSIIEFSHRTNGTLLGLAVLATFLVVVFRYRAQRRLLALSGIALALVAFEGAVGGTVVYAELAGALVMFHFAVALIILGVLLTLVFSIDDRPMEITDPAFRRLIGVATGLTFVLLLTGASVTATSADERCLAWPLCGNGFGVDLQGVTALNYVHRGAVLVLGLLLLHVATSAFRRWRGVPGIGIASAFTTVAFLLQVVDGALLALTRNEGFFSAAHVAFATATWVGIVSLVRLSRRHLVGETATQRFAMQGEPTA